MLIVLEHVCQKRCGFIPAVASLTAAAVVVRMVLTSLSVAVCMFMSVLNRITVFVFNKMHDPTPF